MTNSRDDANRRCYVSCAGRYSRLVSPLQKIVILHSSYFLGHEHHMYNAPYTALHKNANDTVRVLGLKEECNRRFGIILECAVRMIEE